jgi:hypothetical protein
MEATGKIIAVMPAQSGVSQRTGQTWMTQQYVLEVPGMYPRKMVFDVFGEDKIKKFNVQQGMEATVSFEIDAHEYNGRWFNEVRGGRKSSRTAAADCAKRCIYAVAYGR